ncbi:MAG: DoxX family membrane protein [Proteobacteria bacterium]|nr:DoxX family membrane protein [Pseudomonadota bacterium]
MIRESYTRVSGTKEWIELILRWLVGCVFIYASFHKISDPALFAKSVYSYALFPSGLINLIAIVIPYIELLSGLFLVFGVYPRGASSIINGLLVLFIVCLSINLIRGHQFDCGCLSAGEEMDKPTRWLLIRDILYLMACAYVFFYKGRRRLSLMQ